MDLSKDSKSLNEVIYKAWDDASFKNNLINSPVSTLRDLLGNDIKLPEGKKVVVVDQSDSDTFFINIPAKPNMEALDVELNEEQLDFISGGAEILLRPRG
jgi:hypothetical protein